MKLRLPILMLLILIPLVVIAAAGFYTVDETEQAVITEFGKPVGEPVTEAGLNWKTPFIQSVHKFDRRVQEFDGEPTEIPTRDKKFIHVDSFARWKIVDALAFYKTVQTPGRAQRRLDNVINSETRDAVSNQMLIEVVRNSNRELLEDEEVREATRSQGAGADIPAGLGAPVGGGDADVTIQTGREKMMQSVLVSAREKVKRFGIELLDVRIKDARYVDSVQANVFDRMRSERQQIAAKYRAEGDKFSAEMIGRTERERSRILSEAYRKAEGLKGEAEAEAARIYADAYGRDPEFYQFWKTLEIYRETIGGNMTVVLGTDSDLLKYLKRAGVGG